MYEPQMPREQTFTYWKNPTEDEVRADVAVGPSVPSGRIRYTWKPGETKPVPSEYDNAIRHDRGAGIIIGLAPQLVKVESAGVAPMTSQGDASNAPRRPRGGLPPDAAG